MWQRRILVLNELNDKGTACIPVYGQNLFTQECLLHWLTLRKSSLKTVFDFLTCFSIYSAIQIRETGWCTTQARFRLWWNKCCYHQLRGTRFSRIRERQGVGFLCYKQGWVIYMCYCYKEGGVETFCNKDLWCIFNHPLLTVSSSILIIINFLPISSFYYCERVWEFQQMIANERFLEQKCFTCGLWAFFTM